MFRREQESSYEEGSGYKINHIPPDVNYNTCSINYTLNNDFSKNPTARYDTSTNRRAELLRTSTQTLRNGGQRPAAMGNPSPMNAQRITAAARPAVKKASPTGFLILPIIAMIIIFSIIGKGMGPMIVILVAVLGLVSSKNKTKPRR